MRCTTFATVLVVVVICALLVAEGKVFTKCGLLDELNRRNFPRSFIGNWICLIESESGKDTSKITVKPDGSKSLGLFQINSKEWCTYKTKGGKCNLKCEDLTNDDITDDARCAKRIYNAHGFRWWNGWKRSCYLRNLPLPPC